MIIGKQWWPSIEQKQDWDDGKIKVSYTSYNSLGQIDYALTPFLAQDSLTNFIKNPSSSAFCLSIRLWALPTPPAPTPPTPTPVPPPTALYNPYCLANSSALGPWEASYAGERRPKKYASSVTTAPPRPATAAGQLAPISADFLCDRRKDRKCADDLYFGWNGERHSEKKYPRKATQ